MRLATLRLPGGTNAAVVHDDLAIGLPAYEDVGALLRDEGRGLEAAREAAASEQGRPYEKADILRPVLSPGATVCVGLNYRTHILEMGRELPTSPTLFSKLARAMTDPYADVAMPAASEKVDYEAELAVVIGRRGRRISPDDAWDHVAGLTVLNDVTARDFQKRTIQWFAGKTFQESTPWGPWIVTPDEVGPLEELELRLDVNGEERQRAKLGDLVFDVPSLVADLSQIVELAPGDLIATGTPGGVGHAQDKLLTEGDVVTVAIDRVGEIVNRFVAEGS
jgi:acylpyruvate hydrolase